jgi:hypothetical protein
MRIQLKCINPRVADPLLGEAVYWALRDFARENDRAGFLTVADLAKFVAPGEAQKWWGAMRTEFDEGP